MIPLPDDVVFLHPIQPGKSDTPMPDTAEERPEGTPSPTIVADAVRLEGTTNGGSSTVTWLSGVEKYSKFIAGAVGLVAALGFPAVYVQFSQFHIPNIFIPYDRALRAGILPAVTLATVFFYLRWAREDFLKGRALRELGDVPVSMTRILLPPSVAFLGVVVIWFVGFLSLFFLIFHGITAAAAGLLGIRLAGRSELYVTIGLLLITFAVGAFFKRRQVSISSSQDPRTTVRDFLRLFSGQPKRSIRFAVIFTIVIYPAVSVGFLYSIRGALGVLNVGSASWLGNRIIAFLYIVIVLFMCTFGCFMIITWLLTSADQKARRRAVLLLAATICCGYVGAVSLYSYWIYQKVPQQFGGGRPIPVVFWIDKSSMPGVLQRRLPRATFVQQGEKIQCESIYLVYIDNQIAVFSDTQEPPATSVMLPRSSIGAIVAAK